jgi:hypothetical protein
MKFGSDIKIPKYYGFGFGRENIHPKPTVAIFKWTGREPTLKLGEKKAREAMKSVKALKKGICFSNIYLK